MKVLVWALFVGTWAGSIQADSLCEVTDKDTVLEAIAGSWIVAGDLSVETQTLSELGRFFGVAEIYDFGSLQFVFEGAPGPRLSLDKAQFPYDVDQVDDLVATAQADWIMDAVSATPCGPEALLQLTGDYRAEALSENGTMTLIPYFDDQIVLIAEIETRGDWGLAFVTMAALFRPDGS